MSRRRTRGAQGNLVAVLGIEILIFSIIGERFATVGNLFEITRLAVELGLIALALTPIIVTGGIDLSVGSLMGLSAVMFGTALQDWQVSLPAAVAIGVGIGLLGVALNAVVIARLSVPPLIVTLGT